MTVNGEVRQRYDYFLPQNNKITAVTIYYYYNYITGFRFHLSDGSNWDIGALGFDWLQNETVDIAENEVIVGFKFKLDSECPLYTEIQFLTMRLPN